MPCKSRRVSAFYVALFWTVRNMENKSARQLVQSAVGHG